MRGRIQICRASQPARIRAMIRMSITRFKLFIVSGAASYKVIRLSDLAVVRRTYRDIFWFILLIIRCQTGPKDSHLFA